MSGQTYDLFVIGGGSGGVRAARLAGALGKKVGIAEEYRFGGTCVIRGCVPKKLLVYASQFSKAFEDAAGFGWTVPEPSFAWSTLIENKDAEIARLEGLYAKGLAESGVDCFTSRAVVEGPHEIRIVAENKVVAADRILVATGGAANRMTSLPGHELCITSDEAFNLMKLPETVIIKGGGYIAVEFAGIFAGLGSKTTLVYRGDHLLRGFDHDLGKRLLEGMESRGIRVILQSNMVSVQEMGANNLVTLDTGQKIEAEKVMLAVGRLPNTQGLGLENAGVEVDRIGAVRVDEYSRTNVPHILAVGDVTNRVALTPVAIHESMCVVETEFGGNPKSPDHELIPTAVFSQPEIGTVGLGEEAAMREFEELDVYVANFRTMKSTLSGRSETVMMKIVVDSKSDRVLGVHIVGPEAGELVQILGIALKMGARKSDFDRTMAVHPTAAEELVTLYKPSYRISRGERIAA